MMKSETVSSIFEGRRELQKHNAADSRNRAELKKSLISFQNQLRSIESFLKDFSSLCLIWLRVRNAGSRSVP